MRRKKQFGEKEVQNKKGEEDLAATTEITPSLGWFASLSPKALDQEIGNGLKIHIFSLCTKGSGKYFSHVARAIVSPL